MPDKWEYPWFAAWDLAFHCVVLARIDPSAAKHQLLLLFREWYMHPNGQLPAYEWDFSDVNPPVHAWAALTVFRIDGGGDFDFLARVFQKLLINFTWWVNRKDALGDNVFEGGFLGLDNIGPFDRSAALPRRRRARAVRRHRLDGEILPQHARDGAAPRQPRSAYEDIAIKFFEHFAAIAAAMNELWDEEDGFFYDRLRRPDGSTVIVRARSAVGLLPVFASCQMPSSLWQQLPNFRARARWFIDNMPDLTGFVRYFARGGQTELICLVDKPRLERILSRMLDENEFLSPYRPALAVALSSRPSARHRPRRRRSAPRLRAGGIDDAAVRRQLELARAGLVPAQPARGRIAAGPLSRPRRRLHGRTSDRLRKARDLGAAADEIERRLVRLFLKGADGRRPADGPSPLFKPGSAWTERPLFYEYFNGDTGEGLGASHQTGWTALVASLIARRGRRN